MSRRAAPVTLAVEWRSEGHGIHVGRRAAFRIDNLLQLSGQRSKAINARAREAGFTYCPHRRVWVAWEVSAAHNFISLLQRRGYAIAHAGIWPDGPP